MSEFLNQLTVHAATLSTNFPGACQLVRSTALTHLLVVRDRGGNSLGHLAHWNSRAGLLICFGQKRSEFLPITGTQAAEIIEAAGAKKVGESPRNIDEACTVMSQALAAAIRILDLDSREPATSSPETLNAHASLARAPK
jgi:hypothetical protein